MVQILNFPNGEDMGRTMIEVGRELLEWSASQPEAVRAFAEQIAGNLEIYAARPRTPGLTPVLAVQIDRMWLAMPGHQ